MLTATLFPKSISLRAGPVELEFEPANMFARYLRIGSHEIVRSIYAAVRDESWGTLLPTLEGLETEIGPDHFVVRWRSSTPVLEWLCELSGTSEGSVKYESRATVLETFSTMRSGMCVLHPANECKGLPCEVQHSTGEVECTRFPVSIAPHQPFSDVRSLQHSGPNDSRVRIDFEGEVFETEDQRNWTDASFKTYCRPLSMPAPYLLQSGSQFEQSVTVSVDGSLSGKETLSSGCVSLTLDETTRRSLPKVGTMLASSSKLEPWQAERIRSLGFAHVGVEVDLASPDWQADCAYADGVGLPLEIHLRSFDRRDAPLAEFSESIRKFQVARVLLVTDALDREFSSFARAIQGEHGGNIPVFVVSAHNFTELNRNRPVMKDLSGVGFALNPQVHAFDDLSLIESTDMHGETVMNAIQLSAGSSVAVAPITLEPRNWFGREADPRLNTDFGAVWTLASLASLTAGGADSATYFESHGPRGILSQTPDAETPLEHVFGMLLPRQNLPVAGAQSDQPLRATALLFITPYGPSGVLANLTEHTVQVRLGGRVQELSPFELRAVSARGEQE